MELMAMTVNNQAPAQQKNADNAQLSQSQSSGAEKNSLGFKEKLDQKRRTSPKSQFGKMEPKNPQMRQGSTQPRSTATHREVDPVQRKERSKDAANGMTEAVDSLTRRAALQSFIRKMKQDLNVNPSEIVSAFMTLSPEQMKLPPKMNINSIIGQLGLDPVAAEKASIYFDQMVSDTAATSIADYLKGSDRQISLEVMSQNERRKAMMESSLDSMNDKFFSSPKVETLNQPMTEPQSQAEGNQDINTLLAGLGMATAGLAGAANSIGQGAAGAAGQAGSATQQSTAQMTSAFQELANQAPSMMPDQGQAGADVSAFSQESSQFLEQMQGFEAPKAGLGTAGLAAYGATSAAKSAGSAASGMTEAVDSATSFGDSDLFAGMTESSSESETDSSNLDFSQNELSPDQAIEEGAPELETADDIQFTVRQEPAKPGEKVSNVSSNFQVDAQPTEAENAKNVRDIVEQTQFLMKKGGGEAKVTLNPEGMGQINLKVVTEGDQVSVDMVTESAEAKKLIEKGLGDLKATLASHKLNVENMKVDMAAEISKQFDHAHDEAQRQSAQHFMENFRQENGSWRQSFFDVPGVRAPRSQSEEGLTLESLNSNKKKSSSRRLDLVA